MALGRFSGHGFREYFKAEMKVRRFIYEAKEGLMKTVPELD